MKYLEVLREVVDEFRRDLEGSLKYSRYRPIDIGDGVLGYTHSLRDSTCVLIDDRILYDREARPKGSVLKVTILDPERHNAEDELVQMILKMQGISPARVMQDTPAGNRMYVMQRKK